MQTLEEVAVKAELITSTQLLKEYFCYESLGATGNSIDAPYAISERTRADEFRFTKFPVLRFRVPRSLKTGTSFPREFHERTRNKITKIIKIILNSRFGFRANPPLSTKFIGWPIKNIILFRNAAILSGCIFPDVAQAFDRLWHAGLLYKLKFFSPTPYLLNHSLVPQNRSYVIRYGNSYSSNFCTETPAE